MNKRKIYVASSWRNKIYDGIVAKLKELGHEVYDFRNPEGGTGFSWSQIDEEWKDWSPERYVFCLNTDIAQKGFDSDFNAMKWADTCVMVLPCGRSANTEAGWMKGAGKEVYVYQETYEEPELMYKMHDGFVLSMDALENTFKITNN